MHKVQDSVFNYDVSVDVKAAESIHEEGTPWREKTMFN